jgi:hypothetical protein
MIIRVNHTDLNHRFAIGRQYFIIAAMPSIVQPPRAGPFDYPPLGNDLKAFAGMLHDLQVNLLRAF